MVVKQIFSYLHGTYDYGLLCFDNMMDNILKGYCDFNFVGDQNDCKSCISYVFTIANATISWTKQTPRLHFSIKHIGYVQVLSLKA